MIYHLSKVTKHFLLWFLILFAIGLSCLRFFLLGMEYYKTDLENIILELTDIPIQIGTISANMRGFSPEVILKDIQVLLVDEDDKPTIQLEQMRLGIDLMELMLSRQLLQSSWITLVGAKLSIIRKKDGSISIVGLNASESEQPLWLFKGARYEVLKSEITWKDELGLSKPFNFNKIDVLIKNKVETQTHEIHLISNLANYGNQLRLSMSFQGDFFEADNISANVYLEGNEFQVGKFLNAELPLGLKIVSGTGSFKIWSQWEKSRLVNIIANVQAKDSVIQNQKSKKARAYEIKDLQTQFNGSYRDNKWHVRVNDLTLETKKQAWPTAEFSFSIDEDISELAAHIKDLDLQLLTEIIQFLAGKDKQKIQLLSELNIKGLVKGFFIYADIKNNKYAVNGEFEKISTQAILDYPQLTNFTGYIKGSNDSGYIQINTYSANLFFPSLIREMISIEKLTGLIKWRQLADEWKIFSEQIIMSDKNTDTISKMDLSFPKDSMELGVFVDLQVSFSNKDVSQITKYYPVMQMDKEALDWLDKAFVSGTISEGNALIVGQLNNYPFTQGQGVFEVLFRAKDVEMQYDPDWPHLKNTTADVLFYKDSLSVDISHAKVKKVIVNQALVKIPSLENSDVLLVKGKVQGKLIDGLDLFQQTPLQEQAGSVLNAMTLEGLIGVDLDLKIPMIENALIEVDGIAHFKQVALKLNSLDLDVVDISGELAFTENGFFSENIEAQALGYPVTVRIKSDEFNTTIDVKGQTDFLQLQKQFTFLADEFVTQSRISGSTEYQVKLDLPQLENTATELRIKTDLKGVALGLPDSLNKTKEQDKPLVVSMLLNDNELIPVKVNYNDNLKAAIYWDKNQSTLHSAHIVYGNAEAVALKQKTVNIQVNQDKIDVSEWMGLIIENDSVEKQSKFDINEISIITNQLLWKNKNYGAFEIALQRFDQSWHGNLSSSAAKGAFIFPLNAKKNDKIKLDMAYIKLSELEQFSVSEDSSATLDFPLIDVMSEQLWWNDFNLGRLELETERDSDGIRFKRINLESKEHKIDLTANWKKKKLGSVTEMTGTLLTDDIGNFLSQLGFNNDLVGTSAKIDYSGEWSGLPHEFSLEKMDAGLDVDFKGGRIASIEPGFGRILGFIAVEQWVKRLTLDFSDLYKKGLSLNSIVGHFNISKGKAVSKNLLVDAVPARINIIGESDLLAKTLNYRVGVIPKSSAAVPIAGSIVSGIAGTITKALTSDYKEGYFFGSIYEITGEWDDIKVEPLHSQDGIFKKTWKGLTDFSWMQQSVAK